MNSTPNIRTRSESVDDALDLAYDALHDVASFVEAGRLGSRVAVSRRTAAPAIAAAFCAGFIACLVAILALGVIK